MKKFLMTAILALMAAMPLHAQTFELIGRVAWVTTEADEQIEGESDVNPTRFEIDDEQGWGGAINIFWADHITTELGVTWVEPDTIITETSDIRAVVRNAQATILPITAVVQYHFRPDGWWDIYVGAGGAWVLFDDAANGAQEIEVDDIERIEFDDDAGLVANLGINILLADNIAANIDAKYVPLDSATTVVFASGEERSGIDVSFNPLIVSIGASWRF
ncbi:MAG: OmpW family outer membrane protein [Thermoanaerobaculia bacterium]|nr:OmpW family outer membrane protein [Thermoanaerobaculia bacterium]